MARTAIVITKPGRDLATIIGTLAAPLSNGIAIDQANGMVVTPKRANKLFLLFYNSHASSHVVTIRKGAYPPAEDSTQGDLVNTTLPTVAFSVVTGLSGSRFSQKDSSIQIDFDASTTGTVWAFEMPA